MNIISKTFVLIFLFIEFSSFAQSFNDTIFTKTEDTILCQITLVNDHNIFYQYKKKRRTKAADIPRDQVLSYSSGNPNIVEIINRPMYPKCDTCENWVVLKSQDTIFYGLQITFIDENPEDFNPLIDHHVIEKVQIINKNSPSNIDLTEIESIKWNQTDYYTISLTTEDLKSLHSITNAIHIYGETFLSHQTSSGEFPLYAIIFKRGDHLPVPIPPFTAIVKKVTYRYFTVVDGKKVFIPKGEVNLQSFLRNHFASKPEISDYLKIHNIKYHELDKVFEMANAK